MNRGTKGRSAVADSRGQSRDADAAIVPLSYAAAVRQTNVGTSDRVLASSGA